MIEEKVGKKKRMALELMKIREKLMQSKEDYKNIKNYIFYEKDFPIIRFIIRFSNC